MGHSVLNRRRRDLPGSHAALRLTTRASRRHPVPALPARPRGGPDVYEGTGVVNWTRVRAAGHDVGICKGAEGLAYVDHSLGTNVRGIRAAGLPLVIYYFAHPGRHSAVSSAHYFARVLRSVHFRKGEVACLDLELREGLTDSQLQRWADDFFHELHAVLPRWEQTYWEYTSALFRAFAPRPFRTYWVAAYPNLPARIANVPRKQIILHQFTDHATVRGVPGPCDLSRRP